MGAVFLKLLNMSISASWLVLAVLLLRLILKKAPKWVNCVLWAIVAVRLVCPFSLESSFSLIPQSVADGSLLSGYTDDYVGNISVFMDITEEYDQAVSAGRVPILIEEGGSYVVTAEDGISPPPTVETEVFPVLAIIWLVGMAGMMIFGGVSYQKIKKKVAPSVAVTDLVRICDYIDSPFIFGILNPKIYLPSDMDPAVADCVLAHEKAHIQRRDHWWKPLGYLLLTLHWFNPVMWLAYVLLCRDIELACDEKVIKDLGAIEKKLYSEALLSCSVSRRMITACPIAFGEVGVMARVKSVLNYKKPAFWIVLAAVLLCAAMAVCFLTDPAGNALGYLRGGDGNWENTAVKVNWGKISLTFNSEAELELVEEFLNSARYYTDPISESRSEDRAKDYGITLYGETTDAITFWFSGDFTQVWTEDGVKPSLSYEIAKPEQAKTFFETLLEAAIPGISDMETGMDSFQATILEKNEGQLLVAPRNGGPALSGADEAWVSLKGIPEEVISSLLVGDTVEIVYDGLVAETYPPQINGVFSVSKCSPETVFEGVNWGEATNLSWSFSYGEDQITLPEGWICTEESSAGEAELNISIRPEGESEGSLRIRYSKVFAVCGTGLRQEQVFLYPYWGTAGIYDDHALWDYMVFRGRNGDYAIINEGADVWWEAYGDTAMDILGTLILGDYSATEEEVIAGAEEMGRFLDYETVIAELDLERGCWYVTFLRDEGKHMVTVIRMSLAGHYIDTVTE